MKRLANCEEADCSDPDPNIVSRVRGFATETGHGHPHYERWDRVLCTFGQEAETYDCAELEPMTSTEAQT
ncbi:MAG: hypothetical protein OXU72_07440 [Gammaproteobacteria bacterium]|nr:hypothetical protein [Gammaproteobacteria bacterium]